MISRKMESKVLGKNKNGSDKSNTRDRSKEIVTISIEMNIHDNCNGTTQTFVVMLLFSETRLI